MGLCIKVKFEQTVCLCWWLLTFTINIVQVPAISLPIHGDLGVYLCVHTTFKSVDNVQLMDMLVGLAFIECRTQTHTRGALKKTL